MGNPLHVVENRQLGIDQDVEVHGKRIDELISLLAQRPELVLRPLLCRRGLMLYHGRFLLVVAAASYGRVACASAGGVNSRVFWCRRLGAGQVGCSGVIVHSLMGHIGQRFDVWASMSFTSSAGWVGWEGGG